MAYCGEVEIAVNIGHLSVLQERFAGSYRIALSLYKKKPQNALMEKVQPKREYAEPYKSAMAGDLQEEDQSIYTQDETSIDIKVYKARPYILTDSWRPTDSNKIRQVLKIEKRAYFRVQVPCYPNVWNDQFCLQVDFLVNPSISMVLSFNLVR